MLDRLKGLKVSRFVVSVFVLALAALGFCTDPAPAFDWSTDIGSIKTVVVDTLDANITAILTLLGLFVAIAFVWRLLRKAGARTR